MMALRNSFVFMICAVVLAGCVKTTSVVMPEITFTHMKPYSLAVGELRVEQTFEASQTAPRIELRMKQPPVQTLRRWAADRLTAVGGKAFARFVVVDASVIEQALATDGSFTAYFTNEQAARYEATVEAFLEIQSDDGLKKASAVTRVKHAVTIAEKSSLNDREQALFDLVEGLMKEFNARMEKSMVEHLSPWMR